MHLLLKIGLGALIVLLLGGVADPAGREAWYGCGRHPRPMALLSRVLDRAWPLWVGALVGSRLVRVVRGHPLGPILISAGGAFRLWCGLVWFLARVGRGA